MTKHECRMDNTRYGFSWCNVEVQRTAEIDARHVIEVKGPMHTVNIYVSATGKSMRVFKDGKELT